jgi:lambda family phage tail tape measure protein
LATAFVYGAQSAKSFGMTIEETAAFLGVLADGGIEASMGGTALRQVMNKLAQPSKEAQRVFKDLGFSLEEMDVKTQGVTTVFQRLASAGVTPNEMFRIFEVRAGNAGLIMAATGKKMEAFVARIKELKGETKRVSREMDDNLNGSLFRFKSALNAINLALGKAGLEDSLRSLLSTVTDGFRLAARNADKLLHVAKILAYVLGVTLARKAIGILIKQLHKLALAFAKNPIGALLTVLTFLIATIIEFRNEIKLSSDGMATLGDAMNVVWRLIKAGAKIIWEALVPAIEGFMTAMDAAFGTEVFGDFEFSIKGVAMLLARFADMAVALFVALWDQVNDIFDMERLAKALISGVIMAVNAWKNLMLTQMIAIGAFINTIIQQILRSITNVIKSITALGKAGYAAITGDFGAIGGHLADAEAAKSAIIPTTKDLTKAFKKNFSAIRPEDIIPDLVNPFAGAGDAIIQDIAKQMAEAAKNGEIQAAMKLFFQLTEAEAARRQAQEKAEADELAALDKKRKAMQLEKKDLEVAVDLEKRARVALYNRMQTLAEVMAALHQESRVLRLNNADQEVANELIEINNKFRKKGIELSQEELKFFASELQKVQMLRLQAEVYNEIRGPQEDFHNRSIALKNLYDQNRITLDEYNKKLKEMKDNLISTTPELQSLADKLWNIAELRVKTLEQAFKHLEDALVSFVTTGKMNFTDLINSMIKDLARLAVQQGLHLLISLLGGGGGGGIVSLLTGGGGGGGGVDAIVNAVTGSGSGAGPSCGPGG